MVGQVGLLDVVPPLFPAEEMVGIIPADSKKSFDIRKVEQKMKVKLYFMYKDLLYVLFYVL